MLESWLARARALTHSVALNARWCPGGTKTAAKNKSICPQWVLFCNKGKKHLEKKEKSCIFLEPVITCAASALVIYLLCTKREKLKPRGSCCYRHVPMMGAKFTQAARSLSGPSFGRRSYAKIAFLREIPPAARNHCHSSDEAR